MKRGFTLIEVMVALAISGVIIAGATGAVMSINTMIGDSSKRSGAVVDALRIEEFLISRLQGAGGGSLRPHISVFVEDGHMVTAGNVFLCRTITGMPGCNSTDRVTVLTQDTSTGVATCDVTIVGNVVTGTASPCCFDSPAATTFVNRQAVILGATTNVSVYLTNRAGTCNLTAAPGQANVVVGSTVGASVSAIAGATGQLVLVSAFTDYVDTSSHTLYEWVDTNGDLTEQTSERALVDDDVYDLQLALGYDGNPEDGVVTDTNASTDEWLFNVAADGKGPGDSSDASWKNVATSQLRMVEVGLIVGVSSQTRGGNSFTLMNGIARTQTGIYMFPTSSKAYLRNLNLFTQ